MTVAELRYKMGTSEFYEWVSFYSYEAKMRKIEEDRARNKR